MKRPTFRPAAAREVREAWAWYEERRPGLGAEFLAEFQECVRRIGTYPEVSRVVHRDVRRALRHRFPYALFYRLLPDRPVVIACFHTSREPRGWKSRT